MHPRFIKKGLRTAAQEGSLRDEQFFDEHPLRSYRIREGYSSEFEQEFISLGDHDATRRRVIVKRVERAKARQFGIRFMPIPFLLLADESIRDDDATLGPLYDAIMEEAATDYGIGT